jgi:hypothetical protein
VSDTKRDGSVFILDRAGRDRPALEQAFAAVGLHPMRAADLTTAQPLTEQLQNILRTVRFVLVVVDDDPIPSSVMFEAGLASGVGAPVVVLDGRDPDRRGVDDLALDTLQPGPRLYARLTDPVGLTEQLEAYLEPRQPQSPRVGGQAIPRPSSRPTQAPAASYDSESVRRTAEALTHMGATVFGVRAGPTSVPDLAVRFPHLDPMMNPVLVEVKGRRAQLRRARSQLADALARGHVHLGLLVTLDPVEPRCDSAAPGQVIAQISLSHLEQSPDRLIKLLSQARSLAVHGG